MQALDLEQCRSSPLFAHLCDKTASELLADAQLRHFPPDTTIVREGDAVDGLHVVLEGQVELHGSWNGQETALAVVRPTSTFILAAIILDADALMSARTLVRSKILTIPSDAVRRAMATDNDFSNAISRDLAEGFRTMVRALKNQKLRSGVERLANYLVTQHRNQSSVAGDLVLPHEKRVLASLLGMTPENLSRAFAALRDHGVRVNGAIVTIADAPALCALAKPDAPPLLGLI